VNHDLLPCFGVLDVPVLIQVVPAVISVCSIPRFSTFTRMTDPLTTSDLKSLARDIVEKEFQELFKFETQ
jgi:hypothetical protein